MTPLVHAEHDPYLYCPPVVQVPDGMTADEARQILDDHRPWVSWPVRKPTPPGARCRQEWAPGDPIDGGGQMTVWVHPDDVTDPDRHPDADLIDDLATDLRKAWDATSGLARYPVSDPVWGDLARVAIERVRAEA